MGYPETTKRRPFGKSYSPSVVLRLKPPIWAVRQLVVSAVLNRANEYSFTTVARTGGVVMAGRLARQWAIPVDQIARCFTSLIMLIMMRPMVTIATPIATVVVLWKLVIRSLRNMSEPKKDLSYYPSRMLISVVD